MNKLDIGLIAGACGTAALIFFIIITCCIVKYCKRRKENARQVGNGNTWDTASNNYGYDVEAQRERSAISNYNSRNSSSFSREFPNQQRSSFQTSQQRSSFQTSQQRSSFQTSQQRSSFQTSKPQLQQANETGVANGRSNQVENTQTHNQPYRFPKPYSTGQTVLDSRTSQSYLAPVSNLPKYDINKNPFSVIQPSSSKSSFRNHVEQVSRPNYHQNSVSHQFDEISIVSETAAERNRSVVSNKFKQQMIISETIPNEIKIFDLHEFTLKEAMTFFKMFLKESNEAYRDGNFRRNDRFIEVITGRGLHSVGGKPIIKPAVENYLMSHDYTYSWSNPGRVRIDLLSIKESDS